MKGTHQKRSILAIFILSVALLVALGQAGSFTPTLQAQAPDASPTPPPTGNIANAPAGAFASCTVISEPQHVTTLQEQNPWTLTYTAMDTDDNPIQGIQVAWSLAGISASYTGPTSGVTGSDGTHETTLLATKPGGQVAVTATGTGSSGRSCTVAAPAFTVTVPTPTPTPIPPPATATPTPVATPATTPEPPMGGSQAYATPQGPTTLRLPDESMAISLSAGSLSQPVFISMSPRELSDVAAMPTGLVGVRAVDISFKDISGNDLSSLRLNRAATLTVNLTQDDMDNLIAGAQFVILRYNSANEEWVELRTAVNIGDRTASTQVIRFSDFVLAAVPQPGAPTPTPTPTAEPPPTGDVSPNSSLLIVLALVGLLAVVGGGYFLRRSRV